MYACRTVECQEMLKANDKCLILFKAGLFKRLNDFPIGISASRHKEVPNPVLMHHLGLFIKLHGKTPSCVGKKASVLYHSCTENVGVWTAVQMLSDQIAFLCQLTIFMYHSLLYRWHTTKLVSLLPSTDLEAWYNLSAGTLFAFEDWQSIFIGSKSMHEPRAGLQVNTFIFTKLKQTFSDITSRPKPVVKDKRLQSLVYGCDLSRCASLILNFSQRN